MNKVLDLISRINQARETLSLLNNDYVGKRKGQIYYTTLSYNKKKIKDFIIQLRNLGRGKYVYWEYKSNTEEWNKKHWKTIILPEEITEDEIKAYFDFVLKKPLTELRKSVTVETGFPRVK